MTWWTITTKRRKIYGSKFKQTIPNQTNWVMGRSLITMTRWWLIYWKFGPKRVSSLVITKKNTKGWSSSKARFRASDRSTILRNEIRTTRKVPLSLKMTAGSKGTTRGDLRSIRPLLCYRLILGLSRGKNKSWSTAKLKDKFFTINFANKSVNSMKRRQKQSWMRSKLIKVPT